jgi:hypothetical protein
VIPDNSYALKFLTFPPIFSISSILHLPGINAPYVHVHPVSSVVFFGILTSSLDTPQKSCDNGEKAIEDTPGDPS